MDLGEGRDPRYRYVLVYVELLTRRVWLRPLESKSALGVINEVGRGLSAMHLAEWGPFGAGCGFTVCQGVPPALPAYCASLPCLPCWLAGFSSQPHLPLTCALALPSTWCRFTTFGWTP